jgi:hypothetical protein
MYGYATIDGGCGASSTGASAWRTTYQTSCSATVRSRSGGLGRGGQAPSRGFARQLGTRQRITKSRKYEIRVESPSLPDFCFVFSLFRVFVIFRILLGHGGPEIGGQNPIKAIIPHRFLGAAPASSPRSPRPSYASISSWCSPPIATRPEPTTLKRGKRCTPSSPLNNSGRGSGAGGQGSVPHRPPAPETQPPQPFVAIPVPPLTLDTSCNLVPPTFST